MQEPTTTTSSCPEAADTEVPTASILNLWMTFRPLHGNHIKIHFRRSWCKDMPLSLLDEKVRHRLRTGVAITSMAQCVGELVENAVDASAKSIAVRIDVSKYKIQVANQHIISTKLYV